MGGDWERGPHSTFEEGLSSTAARNGGVAWLKSLAFGMNTRIKGVHVKFCVMAPANTLAHKEIPGSTHPMGYTTRGPKHEPDHPARRTKEKGSTKRTALRATKKNAMKSKKMHFVWFVHRGCRYDSKQGNRSTSAVDAKHLKLKSMISASDCDPQQAHVTLAKHRPRAPITRTLA